MRAQSGFVRVVPSDELTPFEGLESQIRCVRVGNHEVLVGRLESGQVVAFAASCPHEMTDLGSATFVDGRVRCPKHNYLYDPGSGANIVPREVSRPENLWKLRPGYLPTYRTEELDGWVWVSKAPNPAPESWDPTSEQRPPGVADGPVTVMVAPEPGPQLPEPAVEHPAEVLRMRVGGELEVHLPTVLKPAYMWRIDFVATTLAVVAQSFDPAATPPQYHVRVRADGTGEATLRCSYRRPWDVEPAEIRTYLIDVRAP